MDLELEGKKALVTGGSRGIGKAVARSLAREGCDVAICARNEGPLLESAHEISAETGRKVFPMTCDTLDPEQIQAFVRRSAEELGALHIVINNAARVGGTPGDVETITDREVLTDFEEKVVGYLRTTQAALPHLKAAGWGRVIHISGGAGRNPGTNISGGVRNIGTANMTKSMANQLGRYGITVNCVFPGMTLTEATFETYKEAAHREGVEIEDYMQRLADRTAIKHVPTAQDVANVVLFLCSPLSISITGEVIAAMGGASPDVHV
jgi:NAD(P)-dependent dehydrogenase (short-subunit alcohol dehydrogenase family)